MKEQKSVNLALQIPPQVSQTCTHITHTGKQLASAVERKKSVRENEKQKPAHQIKLTTILYTNSILKSTVKIHKQNSVGFFRLVRPADSIISSCEVQLDNRITPEIQNTRTLVMPVT